MNCVIRFSTVRVMGRVNPVVRKWQCHVLVYFFPVVDVYNVTPIAKHHEIDKSFREGEDVDSRKISNYYIMNVIVQSIRIKKLLLFLAYYIYITVVP